MTSTQTGKTANNKTDNVPDWPQDNEADFIMECMMGHYMVQNEIIRTKLRHARTATRQSMEDIENIAGGTPSGSKQKELKKIRALDGLWDQLNDILQNVGLTEGDIANIEKAVTATPDIIRNYYDVLVEQDRQLSNLIYEMETETFKDAYQQAMHVTEEIQARPNPLSGLTAADYEPDDEQIERDGIGIVEIITLQRSKQAHGA